ncbi:MAG TPA: Crp/Fnr family transcriptional regulator [Nitrospirota bacterium]|nr:Crp/Fnr family transcriptional regulator [Nitrospirota bacterium]
MLVEYLKNIPLFKHLKDSQLREIAARCKSAQYKKGDVIFHKSDLSTDLYIVNSGKLKALLVDEEGDEIVLAQFEKGAFFGELSLLDGKGRSATIVVEKESELSILKKEMFFDILYKDPRIAVELMATLVERLRKADEMIESLAFLEVGERLIKSLLEHATPVDGPISAGSYLKAGKLTHKELAARIGSSREAVSKCLKVLMAKAIVKEADSNILIARNALERLKEHGRA